MEKLCPFGSTLVSETCRCDYAEQVVRRGGAEIICQNDSAHSRCVDLFQRIKEAALPAFDVEDDLTIMPHSVLQKIQFGGLLGLQSLITGQTTDTVANVVSLVDTAEAKYHDLASFPYAELITFISTYKLKRRHGRG